MKLRIGPLHMCIHRVPSKWRRVSFRIDVIPSIRELRIQFVQVEILLIWIRRQQ